MDEMERTFTKVVAIIESAKKNAYRKVNEELINMYWRIGQFISEEAKTASYGDSYIDELSRYIQDTFPGIKGFNRRGLYRMKQFYETYANYEKVSPLVTQINWTNNLLILSGTKSIEEKEFYLRLCIQENYSKRELERQLDSAYYERYMLSKGKALPEGIKKINNNPFFDSYVVEFLDLPSPYKENDLRKALILKMRDFILELGRDFTYIDESWIKKGALISLPSAARFDEDFLINRCRKVVDNYKLYEAWAEEFPYPSYELVQIIGAKFTDLMHEGKINREDIIEIADVVQGRVPARESEDDIIVYSVGGMPVEDIAWGSTVYHNALKMGIGVELPLWEKPELA